jgi:crotonobetainyl-CoA:carnitine CoA-transferase CaiB-like acyl-CoA transferase
MTVSPLPESTTASPLSMFLEGVKVIDLSQYIPGPMATLFLRDMGAEVIKVEPPQGDGMKALGPRDGSGQSIFYRALNAGKSLVTLNLRDDEDRAYFLSLVRDADLVVEGFRPGVLGRLGIDYPVLKAANPAIVLCSISGYGAISSFRHKAGHDANYLAAMGVLHRNGGTQPEFYDPPVSDVAGALFATMTILGALHRRQRTGMGCMIDMALADTIMPMQLMQVAAFGENGVVPQRGDNYLNGAAAYYQVYETKDRQHVVLGAVEPKFWAAFCMAAERPDLLDRQEEDMPQAALKAEVGAIFASMTAEQAAARFGPVDCCFSIVEDLGDALASPLIAERRLVRRSGTGNLQTLYPAWIDGVPPSLRPDIAYAEDVIVQHPAEAGFRRFATSEPSPRKGNHAT